MELLSKEHRVGGLDISGHGLADERAREAALEGKIAEHDPGFLGAVGSSSAGQSRQAIARFEEEMYRRMAASRRSVAAFIGNMVGFSVDLAALRTISFIGGLSSAGSRAATAKISNDILKGAVRDSVAFSLDVTEVELPRALADERVSLRDVVDRLPPETLCSALIGGTSGAIGGAIRGKFFPAEAHDIKFKEKILDQIRRGAQLPNGPSIGNKSYKNAAEYDGEVSRLVVEYSNRVKDITPSVTVQQLETLIG
jgi:hypothetical protein